MNPTTTTHPEAPASGSARHARTGRLMIDAPTRAFHWLFALSFAGAWLTAESERWRGVHVTLGYAFGGLLLFRLAYGWLGPRQARLGLLWHRVSGVGDWLRSAKAGRIDLPRAATLVMGVAMLLLLWVAAPLVLSGYAGYVEWLGMEDALEEVHEFFANAAMALVLTHLALIALLSVLRRRNLARPMLTGRTAGVGPDLVKANRAWLAIAVVVAYLGFVAWQTAQGGAAGTSVTQGERRGGHHDDDD
jgi:cytochrome b